MQLIIWAAYEGSTLRAKNDKVLYKSVRRMGSDTAPAKRLHKQGHNNMLVDCFMKGLNRFVPAGDRREVVINNKCLKWNSQRADLSIKVN